MCRKLSFLNFFQANEDCNAAPEDRTNCGYAGIGEARCLQRGCCYDNSIPHVNWCFQKKGETSLSYFGVKLSCVCLMFAYPGVSCGGLGVAYGDPGVTYGLW